MPNKRLEKLEEFFLTVAKLTANHDGIHFRVTNEHKDQIEQDIAVVYPSKLGAALEKVDPEWWRRTSETEQPKTRRNPPRKNDKAGAPKRNRRS
jgi:hypothetical protein